MHRLLSLIFGAILVTLSGLFQTWTNLLALESIEVVSNQNLEVRARTLNRQLRCVVCQNQSIDESNAELARDMRILVRNRISAGDTDADIIQFLVARYGDFITLMPPLKPTTWVLWFSPILFLLIAMGITAGLLLQNRGNDKADAVPLPLSNDERYLLNKLIQGNGEH